MKHFFFVIPTLENLMLIHQTKNQLDLSIFYRDITILELLQESCNLIGQKHFG